MSGSHRAEPSRPAGRWRRRSARTSRRRRIPTWYEFEPVERVDTGLEPGADWAHDATYVLPPEVAAVAARGVHPVGRERRSRRRLSRRIRLGIAGTTAAAGLAVAAAVAWMTVGVAVVKPDSDAEVTSAIRQHWAAGAEAYDGRFIGIIRIPRFGRSWEFSIARGTDLSVLAHGAGWYPDGARPGEVGNVVVSAHRVTHNAPFHDFPKLRRGDRVIIETRNRVYTYKMVDDGNATSVPDTTLWPLWPVPDPKSPHARPTDRVLTLITCAQVFHTDQRLVARAQQVSSSPRRT